MASLTASPIPTSVPAAAQNSRRRLTDAERLEHARAAQRRYHETQKYRDAVARYRTKPDVKAHRAAYMRAYFAARTPPAPSVEETTPPP